MANSYENTKMPERPEITIKPDAIPVDDKGQPLPDPTENLSSYLAPKGIEELRKAYSDVEEDEDVKETMEPPQRANLMRRFKGSKKGYDFYGTPAKSIPNDNNGTAPSPLTELFSEAEALEPNFDIDKIKEHVLQKELAPDDDFQVVETPKLSRQQAEEALQSAIGGNKKSDDLLRRTEVVKDPNAPKFLEMYKESTNTKVIYQFNEDGTHSGKASSSDGAEAVFAENSPETKPRKRFGLRENKKKKGGILHSKRGGEEKEITSPEEIASLRAEAAKADAKKIDREKEAYAKAAKKAELEAKAAREEAERLRAELEEMKAAAAKALQKRQAEADSFRPSEEEKSDINGAE